MPLTISNLVPNTLPLTWIQAINVPVSPASTAVFVIPVGLKFLMLQNNSAVNNNHCHVGLNSSVSSSKYMTIIDSFTGATDIMATRFIFPVIPYNATIYCSFDVAIGSISILYG